MQYFLLLQLHQQRASQDLRIHLHFPFHKMVCDHFFTFFAFSTIWHTFFFSTFHKYYHPLSLPSIVSISIPQPQSKSYLHLATIHSNNPVPPLSAILAIKGTSGIQWVRAFCEDWRFIDLSLLSRIMDRDKSLIPYHSDSENRHVTSSSLWRRY